MKLIDIFFKNKSISGISKKTKLPDIIKVKNDLMINKELVDDLYENQILKNEDLRKNKIKIKNYDFFYEYEKRQTFNKTTLKVFSKLFFKIFSQRNKYSTKRLQDKYFMNPNFGEIENPKNSYIMNFHFYIYILIISFSIGYLWAKFRYDIYLRKLCYNQYPKVIINFEKFDSYLRYIDNILNYYYPKNFTEEEYKYLLHKYIFDFKERSKLNREIKKYEFIDDDVIKMDNILNKIK